MKNYLVMLDTTFNYQHPYSFTADDDQEAEKIAFRVSGKEPFNPGVYDLYRIELQTATLKHPYGFTADDDQEAETIAIRVSGKELFKPGVYNLYRIELQTVPLKHILVPLFCGMEV